MNSLLESETVVDIFLDLAKAFITQNFLAKITKNGLITESIAMLELFLSNIKYCVKNSIAYSNWVTINHGVPQETVLGLLIFIVFIKDFSEKDEKKRGPFTVCR